MEDRRGANAGREVNAAVAWLGTGAWTLRYYPSPLVDYYILIWALKEETLMYSLCEGKHRITSDMFQDGAVGVVGVVGVGFVSKAVPD